MDSLIGKRSPKAVRKALEKLVTGSDAYDHAYTDAMERIEGQVAESKFLAKDVLSWITCATRSLSTLELQHVLAVEIGEPELDPDNLPEIEDIISVCAGLVTVDQESNIIRLVHYTTQEYFQRTWMSWFSEAHADIAKICVAYLSFDPFEAGFCQSGRQFRERLEANILYDYAARNWGHHAYNVDTTSTEVKELSLTFLQQEAKVVGSCQAMMALESSFPDSQKVPRDMTCVHLAAWFGLRAITASLLEKGYDPNPVDTFGRTPLLYAVENGHITVVKLLIESGADTTAKDSKGRTALHLAALQPHETVVQMLLENGADIEAKTGLDRDVFHRDLTEFLNEHFDYGIKGRAGCTALHWAAAKGHRAVVKLLLDHGADTSSKTGISVVETAGGQTALHLSAGKGHVDVSELLLQEGADIAARDASRGTMALHYAARHGHEPLVQLLLENGNDVNEEDWYGRTALHEAAGEGHYEVARLLVEKGADIEAKTAQGWGGTVLLMAASHDAIVRLLIEKKVDVNRKVGSSTALHYMAQAGNAESIRLTLEAGADIEEEQWENRKALHEAANNLRTEAVQLLLDRGANVHPRDSTGRTALHYVVDAIGQGDKKVPLVRMLLERGADIDAKDYKGETALHKAGRVLNFDNFPGVVSQLLVEKGANIHAKDSQGMIPVLPSGSGGWSPT